MLNTVLGEIYSNLSKDELKHLNIYINSSVWRESPTIVMTHQFFFEYIKSGELESKTKEELFYLVYPDDNYNDSKLRFTQNRLLKAIKEFFTLRDIENSSPFTDKVWQDVLIKKKLRKNIQYHLQDEINIENSEYRYLYNYFKSQEQSTYDFSFTKNISNQYDSIIKIIDNAQLFSDLVFIRNYCSLISFKNVYKSIESDLPIEKFNQIKENQKYKDVMEFKLYISLVNLLISKGDQEYLEYKSHLFNHIDALENSEKTNLLAYLQNHVMEQVNRGNTEYIDIQYQLFLDFEAKDIFSLQNFINVGRINNVILSYIRNKDLDRAEKFIQKYVPLLNLTQQDSCRHFNIARIKFEAKEYKLSLRELLQVDFSKDPFYSLNSKVLLLKTYFELKETEAFMSLCVSFNEYIRKNKILSDTYKTSCLAFIKLTNKIYSATSSSIKIVRKNLDNQTQIAEKNWILEKINGYNKG